MWLSVSVWCCCTSWCNAGESCEACLSGAEGAVGHVNLVMSVWFCIISRSSRKCLVSRCSTSRCSEDLDTACLCGDAMSAGGVVGKAFRVCLSFAVLSSGAVGKEFLLSR